MRGYDKTVVSLAFSRVRLLDRESTLEKVARPEDGRITLVLPFDKRMGNVAQVLRHRWQCLLSREPSTINYMPLPPRVSYSRTSSLRDILVRAKVPPKSLKYRRQAKTVVSLAFTRVRLLRDWDILVRAQVPPKSCRNHILLVILNYLPVFPRLKGSHYIQTIN